MSSGQIACYGYSDSSAQWVSTNVLSITRVPYGGAATSVRHTTPLSFSGMLASWQALLDVAVPAGAPWALSYSATTRRVTLASAGALFDLALSAQVGKWLGYTTLTSAGAATYTGQAEPAGVAECEGLEVAIPLHQSDTEIHRYRHGRTLATTWGTLDLFQVHGYLRADRYATALGYGWLKCGRVRLTQSGGSTANAYSSADLDGYVDGWVQAFEARLVGQAGQLIEINAVISRTSATLASAEVTGFWGALRYGWSPLYLLDASGVPVYWCERATGKTLTAGYTEDASLVIDDSAEVGSEIDRERGCGVGLALGWKILDTSTARTWMRRPAYVGYLQVDLDDTNATVTVTSTTGSPAAPGAIYIGTERITYTGKTGTTFTGCTRGTAGSLAAIHKIKGSAVLVTDSIRTWKGRDVVLRALPCDPSGYVTGTAILDDAVDVWRGRSTASPLRHADGWQFGGDALDRLLERKLAGPISGQLVFDDSFVPVQTAFEFGVFLVAQDSAGTIVWSYAIDVAPFQSGYTNGDMLSAGELRAAISAAWTARIGVLGIGADVGNKLEWVSVGVNILSPRFSVVEDATIEMLKVVLPYWGPVTVYDAIGGVPLWMDAAGMSFAVQMAPWFNTLSADPQVYYQPGAVGAPPSLCIQLDDGAASDCPPSGFVRITSGDVSKLYVFAGSTTQSGKVFLAGLQLAQGGADWPAPWASSLAGATAQIWESDENDLAILALEMLESSGTGNRGAYDVFSQGAGYGLRSTVVNEDSFATKAQTIPLTASVCPSGNSAVELFGGAFALARQAMVQRANRTLSDLRQQIHLVDTTPGGSDYFTVIYDETLLCIAADPVESVERLDPPTVIGVQRLKGPGEKDEDKPIVFRDVQQAESRGAVEASYGVPCDNRAELQAFALERAAAIFASDQDGQAISVRVPPWVVAEPGDTVRLSLRHPSVFDPATGTIGYLGNCRCVGRTINLATQVVTLTLLLEGLWPQRSLCPAGEVVSFTGAAGAATSLSITDPTGQYHAHFQQAIALAGAAVHVYHYQPGGVEADTQRYTLSASALAAGVCTLTIASQTGAFSLSTALRSHVTLPITAYASITTFQAAFAHEDDGSFWV